MFNNYTEALQIIQIVLVSHWTNILLDALWGYFSAQAIDWLRSAHKRQKIMNQRLQCMVKRMLQGLAMDGHARHSFLCHLPVSKPVSALICQEKTKRMCLITPPVLTYCETESFGFTSLFTFVKMSFLQHNSPLTCLHAASLVCSPPHGSHLRKLPAIGKMCATEPFDRAELAGIQWSSGLSSAK